MVWRLPPLRTSAADKRMWPVGTPVNYARRDGQIVETTTRSVPRHFGTGRWGVFVSGLPYVVGLEYCSLRSERPRLPLDGEGTSQSDKPIDPSDVGKRAG